MAGVVALLGVSLTSMTGQAADAPAKTAAGAKPPVEFQDCPTCPTMVVVPAGELTLRVSIVNDKGQPIPPEVETRKLHLPYPYALGKYEVTFAQFSQFVAATNHKIAPGCNRVEPKSGSLSRTPSVNWRNPRDDGKLPRDDEPVRCVRWYDAQAFVEWLSRETGVHYRLPTVDEFQYAAQAGSESWFFWGDNLDDACRYANVFDRSVEMGPGRPKPSANCSDGYAEVAPVGSFEPNRFGLYDMVGNVSEWLSDCFPNSLEHPERGDQCYRRGSRGGSWLHPPLPYRVGFPSRGRPYTISAIFGFRVARDLP
jgi:formylglycine-generating enzyme required for sulfatase activity